MDYRYEYNAIKNFLQDNYYEGVDYLLVPIEDINVKVDNGVAFFKGGDKLEIESVERIYLIDLGKITLSTLQYRIYLLKYFEDIGIEVINSSETILLCRNKIAAYFNFKKEGLPIIPTVSLSSDTTSQIWYNLLGKLGKNFMVKPLLGSRGIGIEYLNISRSKNRLKNRLIEERILVIQKFIPPKNTCDMRALVMGNKVLSAMKRCTKRGSFLTNIYQGGSPYPTELPQNVKSMAIQAARAVNGEIVTVDFIEHEDTNEIFILEVNGFARWEGMQKVTDFNITEKIVEYRPSQN